MEIELNRISVVGLGKLGVPLAACFAAKGFEVIGVDVDLKKVEAVKNAQSPVFEPGLQDLLRSCQGRLTASGDFEMAIMNSEVTFIVVPTPSEDHGGFSLRYVIEAAEKVGEALWKKPDYHLVVLTSTVMPGATEKELRPTLQERSCKNCGQDFGLCYSPEFVALGSVIRNFLNPDFILIGESDPFAGEKLGRLYKKVCENNPPIVRMNLVNAELTKLALNTYVTTKITFANMLARICEKLPGADVDMVTSALGLDTRIGTKYLKGAISYGGPCFPRDNIALSSLARTVGASAEIAETTDRFNRWQIQWLAGIVKGHLPKGGKVGILGLSYKPNTDVADESQGVLLAQALVEKGIPVSAFDPEAMKNARRLLGEKVCFSASAEECIEGADIVILTTPWDQFKQLDSSRFMRNSPPRTVIDCWRILKNLQHKNGVQYLCLGMGEERL
jgi:UDPglucose 6-dehydrogenase